MSKISLQVLLWLELGTWSENTNWQRNFEFDDISVFQGVTGILHLGFIEKLVKYINLTN